MVASKKSAFSLTGIVEALRDNSLVLECSEIELIQEATAENPKTYRGPGCIEQTADGELIFRLYATKTAPSVEGFFPFLMSVAGTLIPDNQYYSFRARDRFGREWVSQRIDPNVAHSYLQNGESFIVASGTLREITHTKSADAEVDRHTLVIRLFATIAIPWNGVSRIETTVAGKVTTASECLNAAIFRACDCEFQIRIEGDTVVIDVESATAFPAHFEMRVIESFQFVLARTLWPRVIERAGPDGTTFKITSAQPPSGRPRLVAPIDHDAYGEADAFWRLFHRYLAFILRRRKDSWHEVTRHLYAVSKASVQSFHLQALALGVAVEGLTKELFPRKKDAQGKLTHAVDALQSFFQAWPGIDDKVLEAELRRRLPGHLNSLTQARPTDRMIDLVAQGWIRRIDVEGWKKVRNACAHGMLPEARTPQDFIDQCFRAAVLMYHLIFAAIGYDGPYQDYSSHGWAMSHYPPPERRTYLHQQTQLAAYYRWQERGCPAGDDWNDWFAAERDLEIDSVYAGGRRRSPGT